jgi:nitrite reductase/ring-hydroxylating ferredoxin subunit
VLGGSRIICPLHAHQFNLETGVGPEPAVCVRVFAVQEVAGDILLRLNGNRT